METKFFIYFYLAAFMIEVTLGRYWLLAYFKDAERKELSEAEKENFRKKVEDFLNRVTMHETKNLWKEENFHECYNNESYTYNMAVESFRKESNKFLEKFKYNSRSKHATLIDEITECIKRIADLLEMVRDKIFIKTQRKDYEEVLNDMQDLKQKIEDQLMRIYEDFQGIEETSYKEVFKQENEKTAKNLKKQFKSIEKASKLFVNDIRQCMNLL